MEFGGGGGAGENCKFLGDYLSVAAAPSTGRWEVAWGQDPAGMEWESQEGTNPRTSLHR